jgi:hypothetical protein
VAPSIHVPIFSNGGTVRTREVHPIAILLGILLLIVLIASSIIIAPVGGSSPYIYY